MTGTGPLPIPILRPPVSEAPRRRTKRACSSCRRKKLKCNGLQPCKTCVYRSNMCTYVSTQRQSTAATNVAPVPNLNILGVSLELPVNTASGDTDGYGFITGNGGGLRGGQKQAEDVNRDGNAGVTISRGPSRGSEEERLNEQSRLLNDGKGRLLYLGDSASLSFLDTIRRLVENTLGPSDFTKDPHRHKLVEGSITVVKKPTHVLPDREAAEFLIDSFFSNTVGILYVLDREACAREVAQIYENPLAVEQSRLSILNLVFAVGLQMIRSSTGHSFRQSLILKRLDASPVDRAELFYLNATYLHDPMQGFEDGDMTSIQALLLITVFMLTVAKRNAAWAYFGMAVRSAYALGLHRKETDLGFAPSEQRMRRNIWKSLYVMDCFLSAMLGRPNSINSRDAPQSSFATDQHGAEGEESIEADALTASTRASQLIGDVLSSVYAERKISVKLAHRLSSRFHSWNESLPPILRWQNISLPNEDPRTTLAQLRVNLSYFHGVILLTRPFLLQRVISLVHPSKGDGGLSNQSKIHGRDETSSASAGPFPPACVRSAVYSVDAVQNALLKRALPRRDPFVIYWLFSAALVVFSDGFANVCTDVDTARAMQTALNLMQYLGEVDPLARRYSQILAAFHAAISRKETVAAKDRLTATRASSDNIYNAFFGGSGGAEIGTAAAQPPNPGSAPLDFRRSSNSNIAPSTNMNNASGGPGLIATGTGSGISPGDYCLDFDAFLNSVGLGAGGSESASSFIPPSRGPPTFPVMTSSHTPQHESMDDWFKAFYAVSDDGTAHEAYPSFFTEDSKLIMGDKVAVGRQEILNLRTDMWTAVSSRHHTFEFFTNPSLPDTYLLQGTVDYEFKDGRKGHTAWVAKAVFQGEGKARRLGFYQVFLNAGQR
ncbi:putative fungal-specific transcription factor [Coniochaeta sp. 2T2.1]|nr:putative fungal-specific transcription factor [Coniochaeta sp. 2T2.1]